VTLSATVPDDWDVKILDDLGEIEDILLESGSKNYMIQITVPETATSLEVITLTAMGTSTAALDFIITPKVYTDEIKLKSARVVWNKGEADALTLFTVPELPSNWDASFISDDLEIASIRIPGGESEAVELIVKPPNSVTSDIYDITVVIESDDGTEHELGFTIEVVGSYELELDMSTLYTTSTIGGSVTYSGTVKNMGQTAITTLYLDAVLPEDWIAIITPKQVSSLDPRDSVTFTVDVELPGDTEAGDYLLTMQAISDQLESVAIDVRVTAQASNTWGFVGIGIAVVVVAGAGLLFRRFKRR